MSQETIQYVPCKRALKILDIIKTLDAKAYGYVIYLKLLEHDPILQLIDVYEILVDLVLEGYLTADGNWNGAGSRKIYAVHPNHLN